MLTRHEVEKARKRAVAMLDRIGIVLTPPERAQLEVVDEGLGDLDRIGLQIVTYVNTARCCAKEIVLFPDQTCPQHRHPPYGDSPGKEETFRCRWGTVYLYVPGEPAPAPLANPPRARYFSVWHQAVLQPGDQFTVYPGTWHWFQAGPDGAVVSEFSTSSTDELDEFTDPEIKRFTVIVDE